jgi:hypothetical protein
MTCTVLLLGLLLQLPPIGSVDSEFDKRIDFAALRTYAWTTGANAFLPEAHRLIVAAIDDEMASLGLKQIASGADVTVAYYTTTITHVDLKGLDQLDRNNPATPAPTRELGKLIVTIRNGARRQLWSAGTREFLESDRTKLGATIKSVTARLFATYPTRAAAK